ncbi:MAG: long-chain fatty acid--CoA ligase [Magnetospirillum sp.]|nr:long-chain fatty acid--CoA ligase [Magnetospirillum sp.]
MTFTTLLDGVEPVQKPALLLEGLNALTLRHYQNCPGYRNILDRLWGGCRPAATLAHIPYVPAALFKTLDLRSVPDDAVQAMVTSSGTSGQTASRLAVDGETAARQTRALAASLKQVLGAKRLPMLLVDSESVLSQRSRFSARAAGLIGLMRHGRDHSFALNDDLHPDRDRIAAFLARHGHAPFIIFGFTFMVWQHLAEKLDGLDLSNGILIHSGGWKALAERAVDNAAFRARLEQSFGLRRIVNFYGMAEQIGSIFLEGEGGVLHAPPISDFIIRHPHHWTPQPEGAEGVIQVLSLIPTSYPGHSLLTEDWGVMEGGALRVLGRVAKTELRGCSDVLARGAE